MRFTSAFPALIAASILSAATARATTVFNFDNDSLGTATGFTDTVGGLAATFASNDDPGGFVVYQSQFETLTGNVLGDPGPAGQNGLALTVAFSQTLGAVSLDFATADFSTPSPFTLDAYQNGTLVGSATQTGQFLSGAIFPEGEIAFGGSNFNEITLSSTAMDFAVDNIAVSGTATPEPVSLALVAAAFTLFGVPAIWRKRRRNS